MSRIAKGLLWSVLAALALVVLSPAPRTPKTGIGEITGAGTTAIIDRTSTGITTETTIMAPAMGTITTAIFRLFRGISTVATIAVRTIATAATWESAQCMCSGTSARMASSRQQP